MAARLTDQQKKFQPTRPLRGATDIMTVTAQDILISTHAPLAGRDAAHRHGFVVVDISTHAPLAGRDFLLPVHESNYSHFNPRAPCGARRDQAVRL